ncbi:ester cyclase [Pedosphaera parvula]|uniref:Ester cyclase n=1 Tax=Pedosphaera parvula (strain Ellin514) TaxID=320771 RepID=B9XD93_PEDPL|nr:ester cyclase [Pedosphaera parvula]EEF62039.1 protein of unknown function DUF1486 [Pedosphaera parvula Ellin514]
MNSGELAPNQMPKEVVNLLYAEFLNEGNQAIADQLISSDFAGPAGKGPESYKASVLPLRQAFPDLHFKIQDMVVEGSRVVVRWTWKATHRGPFAGVPPTGRQVSNEGIAIYRVEDGKIAESWAQMDRLGVLQQIGALPPIGPGVSPNQSKPQPTA